MGFVSTITGPSYGNYITVALGIAVLIVVGFATEKILNRKGMSFWLANGIIPYLFFWLISWIFLFNM